MFYAFSLYQSHTFKKKTRKNSMHFYTNFKCFCVN